jgi:hypothetical protein
MANLRVPFLITDSTYLKTPTTEAKKMVLDLTSAWTAMVGSLIAGDKALIAISTSSRRAYFWILLKSSVRTCLERLLPGLLVDTSAAAINTNEGRPRK